MQEWTKITEGEWTRAIDEAINHCEDGVYCTEKTFQGYDNSDKACALCRVFNNIELHKYCPLGTNVNCCPEWKRGSSAKFVREFPAFHSAYVALVKKLKDIRAAGYDAWRAKHMPPEKHIYKEGGYAKWDGTDGDGKYALDWSERLPQTDNGVVKLAKASTYDWDLIHPKTGKHIVYADEQALSPVPKGYKTEERREMPYGRRKDSRRLCNDRRINSGNRRKAGFPGKRGESNVD